MPAVCSRGVSHSARDLMIASPQRRLLAVAVDIAVVLVWVAGAGLVAVLAYRYVPWARRRLRALGLPPASGRFTADDRAQFDRLFRVPWQVLIVNAVLCRNKRGPGDQLTGIQRVDRRTGGPVTVRGALVRFVARQVMVRLIARRYQPQQRRVVERLKGFTPALREIQQAHRGDKAAQRGALMAFYREHDLNPLSACVRPPAIFIPLLSALSSPRNQTLYDWLSDTVVVRVDDGKAARHHAEEQPSASRANDGAQVPTACSDT